MSRVPLDKVLNTGRFDHDKAQEHPLWFKEQYGFVEHKPETGEYGVRRQASTISNAPMNPPMPFCVNQRAPLTARLEMQRRFRTCGVAASGTAHRRR